MEAISRGDHLLLRNAFGELIPGRALSGIVMGSSATVVWVCAEADWPELEANPDHQAGVPWPVDAVQVGTPA